ncbi:GNAT family N-acetyltransferase [Methylobacterium sp. M6A4_1b]
MVRTETDFATLLDAHLRMQAGCYVAGVAPAPAGGCYVWSALPEPGFNLAIGTRDLGWMAAMARRHGRRPARLALDGEAPVDSDAKPACLARYPTRWMVRDTAASEPAPPEGIDLTVETAPAPGDAFLSVCGDLYAEPAFNAVAQAVFVPLLAAARAVPGVETRHLTLSAAGVPVACASLYRAGPLAGLYNVGTRASHQGRGLGARATRAALRCAAEAGAGTVFLQCVGDGPVERLYRRLGFTVAASPVLEVYDES